MPADRTPDRDRVRTAEIIATLSLATDMAVGFPLEHGLKSTLVAMELCGRLGVDSATASQAYYLCLLFYVGCNAPVDVGWEAFGDDESFLNYAIPNRFGTRTQMASGVMRAVAPPTSAPPIRAWRIARHLPMLALRFAGVVAGTCEVARMLSDRLGLATDVSRLFAYESERWDGTGMPDGVGETDIPLAVRIAHVARDAVLQHTLGNADFVAGVIGQRAGGAFDPTIASLLVDNAEEILDVDAGTSVWDRTLAAEPKPWLMLEGTEIDRALAAMGQFSDIGVPELVGHSAGVAEICTAAADRMSLQPEEAAIARRAALVHDVGRTSVPMRIWEKAEPLTANDWEQVRLHAYHTERLLVRSPFLAELAPAASYHHERLDGTGYHRGVRAPSLDIAARLVAAADVYHAMLESRPYRPALSSTDAAAILAEEAADGRLDPDAVKAVLEASGHGSRSIDRPAGLTEREAEAVRLLARGLQTKQVARKMGISAKTADFHIQSAYRKMDVKTRAGATLFAMQHGLVTWENSR